MIFTILQIIVNIPLILACLLFKTKPKKLDLFITITSVLILSNLLIISNTLRTTLLFIIFFVSLYYSEKDLVAAATKSALIFISSGLLTFISKFPLAEGTNSVLLIAGLEFICMIPMILFEKKILAWSYKKFPKSKAILMFIALILFFQHLHKSIMFEASYPNNSQELIAEIFSGILLAMYIIFAISLFLAQQSEDAKIKAREEQLLYESNLAYMQTLERQAQEMRKFKHDYQNILLSMDTFFEEGRWIELENYYRQQIQPTSDHLRKLNTQLTELAKIENLPLKSLFYTKLGTINPTMIHLSLEVDEPVYFAEKHLILLVRSLGIILDNALEALTELGSGSLSCALLHEEKHITIIVQNDCATDLPPLYQLEQAGFSTKGNGRGLGLANLQELLTTEGFLLETEVIDHVFRQRIIILKEQNNV